MYVTKGVKSISIELIETAVFLCQKKSMVSINYGNVVSRKKLSVVCVIQEWENSNHWLTD